MIKIPLNKIGWFVIQMNNNSWWKGGWGNGYVYVSKGHPWYGVDYNNIELDDYIHGGLTFGEIINKNDYIGEMNKYYGKYVIEFDTNHRWDSENKPNKEYVENETKKLFNMALKAFNK